MPMAEITSARETKPTVAGGRHLRPRGLFVRLALQNVLRRPTRTFLLLLAVALGTGAVFASYTVARGVERSMEQSFARMGADLIVVPKQAMVNITSALLTVQPTEATINAATMRQIGQLDGVEKVAGQTIYRVPIMAGMPECKANLIAFDAKTDFTVLPWLEDHLPRALKTGDLLCGYRRGESVGEEVQPVNVPATIYGKLGRSGVGPFDESFFATYETVASLMSSGNAPAAKGPSFRSGAFSAILVRLAFGATPEQVRFAISRLPGVKVVSGTRIVTSTRQTTTALLTGMLTFTAFMLAAALILVSLVFSGIIGERRREVGLLRAIGSRRRDIMQMLLAEASFITGVGGVLGILLGCVLILGFQRSLIYYLETLHVGFTWPAMSEVAIAAALCALLAMLVGLLGALAPAWRSSAEEPYTLISGEGQ
ncbi:MAG TPA: ABC transporter permease [Candidatus Obscuribacterales bacterium]